MKHHRRVWRLICAPGLALILGLLWSAAIQGRDGSDVVPPPPDVSRLDAPSPGVVVEPALGRRLAEGGSEPIRVIVKLRPRPGEEGVASAVDIQAWIAAQRADLSRRRDRVVGILDEAAVSGALKEERSLWIVQSLAIHGSPSLIRRLLEAPEVSGVWLDHYRSYVDPVMTKDGLALDASSPTAWGVEKIRAPEVWRTLGVSGTGTVVAVMDTGVEYGHPALVAQYRGRLGKGRFTHGIAWYDAVNGGTYPYDDNGHGTHVAGSAVGAEAIGVAPGAQWIGVKVLNNAGAGYDSWILEGFQWLLAPGGDPDLAPDVVNASWSSRDSSSTLFEESINTLQAAGIFPVFASGNSGPLPESVGSPASNRGAFAVGATDIDDEVTHFSGRGPSPWDAIKPQVVAPGADIGSSMPGGIYAAKTGTSMAAPHVAGLGALLRTVSPTLSVDALARTITGTARRLTGTVPNNDSGWGRVDAYAAVLAIAHPSLITGTVTQESDEPLAGIEVAATPLDRVPTSGRPNDVRSDRDGDYRMALVSGLYDLTARGFGYVTQRVERVRVVTDTGQRIDFQLTPRPTGMLSAQVSISGTARPPTLPLQARLSTTPLSTTVRPSGFFTFSAPSGAYTVELRGNGYRVVTAAIVLTAGETTRLSMQVDPAPRLLLVDEGTAYYASEIALWQEALDALRYEYDLYQIKTGDILISQTLLAYDVVLWSSPYGSPGLVAGSAALRGYLERGGRLLLSGQDVTFYDGGGTPFGPGVRRYLYELIGVVYDAELAQSEVVGSGLFTGIRTPIQGGDGADNQLAPDTIQAQSPNHVSWIWRYGDGSKAGAATSICTPFRSLFFGFGYESIADEADRLTVMGRSLAWLTASPLTAGLSVAPLGDPVQIGPPGERVTHTFQVRHIGVAGPTDTLTLSVDSSPWSSVLSPTHATVSPCGSLTSQLVVTVPEGTGVDVRATTTVALRSALVPARRVLTFTSKTPAPILLVDDDRWYPMEDDYTWALRQAGLPYDLWDTKHNLGGIPGARSPSTETLMRYPLVIWFTGYDWFAPIRDEEIPRLLAYLDGGGCLMLTSQSFLMDHSEGQLADVLGVGDSSWIPEPTRAAGVPDHPAGGGWGPVDMVYPYQNWSYIAEPQPSAQPVIRGQAGQPLGIATRAAQADHAPQSLFYSFPLETLPDSERVEAIARGVGWLSPLGDSEWSITPRDAQPGDVLTFALGLRNHAPVPLDVRVTHTLPHGLMPILPLEGGLEYDAIARRLTWQGAPASGERLLVSWQAQWVEGRHHGLTATVKLEIPAWTLAFERETTCCRSSANLAASRWLTPQGDLRTSTPVTLAFALVNDAPYDLEAGKVSVWVMEGGAPPTLTGPLTYGLGFSWWQGSLPAGMTRTLTLPIQGWDWEQPFRIDALMQNGEGRRWESSYWLQLSPWTHYLPLILKTNR